MSKPSTHEEPPASDTERDDVSEGSEESEEEDQALFDILNSLDDSLSSISEAMSSLAETLEKAAERTNKTNKIICKILASIDDTLKRGPEAWASAHQEDAEDDST